MWKEYNPNPTGRNIEDCAIRAVAKALGTDWDTAFVKIAANAFQMGDVMHSDAAWGSVLRQNGLMRKSIPDTCPDCYTAEEFAENNPEGIFVLGFGNHAATIVNGTLFDAFDTSRAIPQYFWYKKEN